VGGTGSQHVNFPIFNNWCAFDVILSVWNGLLFCANVHVILSHLVTYWYTLFSVLQVFSVLVPCLNAYCDNIAYKDLILGARNLWQILVFGPSINHIENFIHCLRELLCRHITNFGGVSFILQVFCISVVACAFCVVNCAENYPTSQEFCFICEVGMLRKFCFWKKKYMDSPISVAANIFVK
jgi:hypothetical protein